MQDKRNYDALKPDPDADIKYKMEQGDKMRDKMSKSADSSASAASSAQANDDDLPM